MMTNNENNKAGWKRPAPGSPLFWFSLLGLVLFLAAFAFWEPAETVGARLRDAFFITLAIVAAAALGRLFVCWVRRPGNLKRFLFGLAVVITLVAAICIEENIRGWLAWKRFQREAAAQGISLEPQSVIPPSVPDEENFAMAPIFKDLRLMLDPEWGANPAGHPRPTGQLARVEFRPRAKKRENFGRDWQTGKRANLAAWQKAYREDPDFPSPPQPGSPAEDVLFALSKFDPVVNGLREAARRPQSRFPVYYEQGFDAPMSHLRPLRTLVSLLSLRATAELAAGQSEQALADTLLILRITESLRSEPFLISHLVRLAMLENALAPVWEGWVDHRWNEEQLAALEEALGKLDFPADCRLAFHGELVFSELYVDAEVRPRPFISLMLRGWVYQNKAALGRLYLESLLPIIDAKARVISPAAARKAQEIRRRICTPRRPWNFMAAMLAPPLETSLMRFAFGQAHADLARAAIALERFRLARGSYPESLDAVAPEFLKKPPHDIVNGGPLKYRRVGDRFLLYSVGWNETDDGGTISVSGKGALQLDQGDWVWPLPSSESGKPARPGVD